MWIRTSRIKKKHTLFPPVLPPVVDRRHTLLKVQLLLDVWERHPVQTTAGQDMRLLHLSGRSNRDECTAACYNVFSSESVLQTVSVLTTESTVSQSWPLSYRTNQSYCCTSVIGPVLLCTSSRGQPNHHSPHA